MTYSTGEAVERLVHQRRDGFFVRRAPADRAAPKTGEDATRKGGLAWPVWLVLLSIAIPGTTKIGDIELSASRIAVLVVLPFCLLHLARGRAGRLVLPDVALGLYCVWVAISLCAVQGIDAGFKSSLMLACETLGSYLTARCFIRSPDEFRAAAKAVFVMICVLVPFALIEGFLGLNVPALLSSPLFPEFPVDGDGVRFGMKRVQTVFEHPILFGACAGSFLTISTLVLGYDRSTLERFGRTVPVIAATLLSLSSAPVGMLVLQGAMIVWSRVFAKFARRWTLFCGLLAGAYVAIGLVSNQSPVQFYISRFTFDAQTAWYRLAIWDFGTASVAAHPLFGVGFGEWARPFWMTASIDNFWLVHFVRFGVPGGVLMLLAWASAIFLVGGSTQASERRTAMREAYVITMASWFFVAATVHLWGSAYVFFLFWLGSGFWLLEKEAPADGVATAPETARAPARPTRIVSPDFAPTGRKSIG